MSKREDVEQFWSQSAGDLMKQLGASPAGFTSAEAKRRLAFYGPVERPRHWDIRFIRNFMIVFGIVSSIFDFLTFAALVFILRATPEQFRTGWFVESVMTEVLIIVVMRTWKPFYKSMPSRPLLMAMILVLLVTLALPYSPLKGILGLTPLPISSLMLLGFITVLYAGASELTKKFFHARAFGKEMTRVA